MNVLVVGTGEIGSAIIKLAKDAGFKVFEKDIEPIQLSEKIDVMHICIPFFAGFEKIVSDYIAEFRPRLTIINSTVRPGTTEKIFSSAKTMLVHSPVRGRHPDLTGGLKKFVKFIGPVNKESGKLAEEHFAVMGLKSEILGSPRETELGKLLSTTYYAVNIAFHQEMYRICRHYGVSFEEAVLRFNATCTMDLNHSIPRPLMFPGVIGGHCLLPNIEILKGDFRSDFLKAVEESNREMTKLFSNPNEAEKLEKIKTAVLKKGKI